MGNIQTLVKEFLDKLREEGIDTKTTYCINQKGEIISFEIEIIGYLD